MEVNGDIVDAWYTARTLDSCRRVQMRAQNSSHVALSDTLFSWMTFGFEAASGQRRSASARAMCPGRAGTNGRATGTRRGRSGVGETFRLAAGKKRWKEGKARWRGGDAAGFEGHGGNGNAP